jgi:hypothetical protein
MIKTKVGKTTDLESRIADYQTSMLFEPEVLDVWLPNPEVSLSSVESGVLSVAEQYAYNRDGEVFVFLQDGYQEFSETINMLLEATTRGDIKTTENKKKELNTEDYTGKVPAVVKLGDETYEVSNWTECLVTVAEAVLSQTEDKELLKQVSGRTRRYVVEEDKRSQQVSPKPIGDSELYIETNFSSNDIVRISKKILDVYDYDLAEFELFVED